VIFRANFERNVEDDAATLAGQEPVRFEKLWNHDAEFFDQRVNVTRFGGESGNIGAGGDPDLGFRVPESVYYVGAIFHSNELIISADRRGLSTKQRRAVHPFDALMHLRYLN